MKNKSIISKGIPVIALVFGLFAAGCPTGPKDNTTPQYTVVFDADGGSVSPTSIQVDDGGIVDSLPVPEITNNKKYFWGWYLDKDVWSNKFTESTPITENITVYARWRGLIPFSGDVKVWANEGTTITYQWSDNNDGFITVTVDGETTNDDWKAQVIFPYFFEKGKSYKLLIEAKTNSDNFTLGRVRWGMFNNQEVFDDDKTSSWQISSTSQTKTDLFTNTDSYDTGEQNFTIFCGRQAGTFVIRVVATEE
jgi:hypothetical protein